MTTTPADPPLIAGGAAFVTVTNAQVYALLSDVDRKVSPLPEKVERLERRTTALERIVWTASGVAGIAGTVLGGVLGR